MVVSSIFQFCDIFLQKDTKKAIRIFTPGQPVLYIPTLTYSSVGCGNWMPSTTFFQYFRKSFQ